MQDIRIHPVLKFYRVIPSNCGQTVIFRLYLVWATYFFSDCALSVSLLLRSWVLMLRGACRCCRGRIKIRTRQNMHIPITIALEMIKINQPNPVIIYIPLSQFQNVPFCPISTLGSNFNPQNIQYIPAVKIFAFLDLEQTETFWNWLTGQIIIPIHLITFSLPASSLPPLHRNKRGTSLQAPPPASKLQMWRKSPPAPISAQISVVMF